MAQRPLPQEVKGCLVASRVIKEFVCKQVKTCSGISSALLNREAVDGKAYTRKQRILLLLLLLRPEALSLKSSSSMLHNYDLLILLSTPETLPILPFLLLFLFYITFIFEIS